jgi:hypothetical protein
MASRRVISGQVMPKSSEALEMALERERSSKGNGFIDGSIDMYLLLLFVFEICNYMSQYRIRRDDKTLHSVAENEEDNEKISVDIN